MTDIHENGFDPAQFLVENVALLPKGRVLDVAMGSGRNALYLDRLGLKVEGVDMSPEAVNTALESAEKVGVSIRAQVSVGLANKWENQKCSHRSLLAP